MERRKILLSSGAVFATVLAGCAGNTSLTGDDDPDEKSDQKDSRTDGKDDKNGDDEKNGKNKNEKGKNGDDEKNGKDGKGNIPGFDRDAFEIDSDVIKVKEISYRDGQLDVRVMITTDDPNELADELREIGPGLARGVEDPEMFLASLEEINFTLYDEHKDRVLAFYLDVVWLREFLEGEVTKDELRDRILAQE